MLRIGVLGLKGELFRYGPKPAQVAFQSGLHKQSLVFIPGLTQGLLSVPYIPSLAATLDLHNWSLVQPLISSSYQGYGTGSLDRDANELRELLLHLKADRECPSIILMGHSTGCQDSVRFMKLHRNDVSIPDIAGVILQAPVSDQEMNETFEGTSNWIQEALKAASKEQSEQILLRDPHNDGTPTTTKRFLSLSQRYGDDDMFSSYFTDDELKGLLGHLSEIKCMIIYSGDDEYVPTTVDKNALCQRFVNAIGTKSEYRLVRGGNHELNGKDDELTKYVTAFL